MSGKPLCPKCGDPVSPRGQRNGLTRYSHTGERKRRECSWHGAHPANVELAEAKGVDKTVSRQLARDVRATGSRRLVITAAQNATPINKAFFAALLTYCKARKAQLIVVPYRYKNPTSTWSKAAEHDDWWAPELAPYLLDIRTDINPNLVLLADIKTQPTASAPLQGFETLTGHKSAIIGHPKLQTRAVPTPQSKMAKLLMTTGAVTEKNYIPSKAGKKGEHHHTFGACVVEVSGKKFHLRRINAVRDGSFCDLDGEYRADGYKTGLSIAALVMGDTHQKFIDPKVEAATFGRGGIVATLRPGKLVWHDVYDQYNGNHHHRGEVFINYAKHRFGHTNLRTELEQTFAFVDRVAPPGVENIFVPSNHPDALARWIKETDPRQDPENCVFWAETFQAMCAATRWTESGGRTIDPFAYWGQRMLKKAQARFPGRNDSVLIRGIDVNHHGDAGPNGARGTAKSFTKIGVKSIIGHSHTPGEENGVIQVGTNSRLDLEYQRGPSSWMHADCIIYENGKRSLLFIVDGEWRG